MKYVLKQKAIYYNNLGVRYLARGWNNKAIIEFTKAIELSGELSGEGYLLSHLYKNRGLAYKRTGNDDNAFEDFDKASKLLLMNRRIINGK